MLEIDVWSPAAAGIGEVTLSRVSQGSQGISQSDIGNIQYQGITTGGGVQISKERATLMRLNIELQDDIAVAANLDEIRIAQNNGGQVFFRYRGLVSSNQGTINNRVLPAAPYDQTYTIGNSSRVYFEAPCLLTFPADWQEAFIHCTNENVAYADRVPTPRMKLVLVEL